MQVRFGGYQGNRSVHTRGLETLGETLRSIVPSAELIMDTDVTAKGASARSLFDSVESGNHNICYMASGYLSARVPSLAVIDLPFAISNREQAYVALDGKAGEVLTDDIEHATGYRVLGYWDNGFRHISNRVRPIRNVADCSGLKIRTLDSPVYQQVLAAMGFAPKVTDVRDLKRVVASGEVDAQENPLTNLVNFKLYEHHPFVSLTGHFYGVALLLCNARWLKELPPASQAAVYEAGRVATQAQRRWAAAEDDAALLALRAAGIVPLAAEQLDIRGFEAACGDIAKREAIGLSRTLCLEYLGRETFR